MNILFKKNLEKAVFVLLLFVIGKSIKACDILSSDIYIQTINIPDYYNALKSKDTLLIEVSLKSLDGDNSISGKAYRGALLMKKAMFQKSARQKFDVFRHGKVLLEESIKKDSSNSEYHFLRLIIQENCPNVLKYYSNISEDVSMVKQNYDLLSPELKKVVADYAKKSKELKVNDGSN